MTFFNKKLVAIFGNSLLVGGLLTVGVTNGISADVRRGKTVLKVNAKDL